MKKYLVFVFMIVAIQLMAQNNEQKKFDFRFGVGVSLLGTGDMIAVNFENEFNYRLNQLFSTSLNLNFGRSNYGVYDNSSFIQGNINVFISPFRNSRKNDFRIGTGFSLMNISDSYKTESVCGVGLEQNELYHFENRNSSGVNIIIEDTYSIKDKFLIGLKLFSQPYFNEDINSGVILKFGLRF